MIFSRFAPLVSLNNFFLSSLVLIYSFEALGFDTPIFIKLTEERIHHLYQRQTEYISLAEMELLYHEHFLKRHVAQTVFHITLKVEQPTVVIQTLISSNTDFIEMALLKSFLGVEENKTLPLLNSLSYVVYKEKELDFPTSLVLQKALPDVSFMLHELFFPYYQSNAVAEENLSYPNKFLQTSAIGFISEMVSQLQFLKESLNNFQKIEIYLILVSSSGKELFPPGDRDLIRKILEEGRNHLIKYILSLSSNLNFKFLITHPKKFFEFRQKYQELKLQAEHYKTHLDTLTHSLDLFEGFSLIPSHWSEHPFPSVDTLDFTNNGISTCSIFFPE